MPTPYTPQTVTITDYFTDGSGNPLDGRCEFRPSVTSKTPSGTITRNPVVAKITGGHLTVVLIAPDSTGVTPQNWTYDVRLTLGPPGSAGALGIDAFSVKTWSIRPTAAQPAVVLRDLTEVDPVPQSAFAVRSVAGVLPDVGGNVALTAADLALAGVGFATQAALDTTNATVATKAAQADLTALATVVTGKADKPPAGDDLDAFLTTFDTHIVSGQTYTDPTSTEVTNFLTGLAAIVRGDTSNSLLTALGFTVQIGYEAVTKRKYALVCNEYDTARCWGAYLIDLSYPRFTGLIEAPHTKFDAGSEFMALQLWRDSPGALLLISGSHRTDTTGTNPRDVAHNANSLFHQVALKYLNYGLPQLSQHGYDDATDTAHDVVVSSGAGNAELAHRRVADAIEIAGFRVARSWVDTGNVLLGTTNVQGIAAAAAGGAFIHIEVNNTTRTTPALLAKYKAALSAANYFGTVDTAWQALANGVSGQFPSAVGSANSAGTSPYSARADHTHRLTSDTPVNGNFVMRVAGAWTSQTPAQAKAGLGIVIADVASLQSTLDDNTWGTSDLGNLGDYVSSVPRYAASSSDTLSNQFLTYHGAIAMRSSFTATRLRLHVRTAVGSPGIVTLALFKGTNRTALTKVVADSVVTTAFSTTGPKEFTFTGVTVNRGEFVYLALLHTNAGTDPVISTLPGPPSADLINPSNTQMISGYKSGQTAIPATLDTSASFTANGRIAWFALAP